MIYKKGIRINKIELDIDTTSDTISCHLHLSNRKVYSLKPKSVDPSVFHNSDKLFTFCVGTAGLTVKALNKEMENDKNKT